MLVADTLKTNQCAMDGVSTISKIIEIKIECKVKFDHTRIKTTQEIEETHVSKGKIMVPKYDLKSKEERKKCEE